MIGVLEGKKIFWMTLQSTLHGLFISSSIVNFFPPCASLRGQIIWWSHSARSGESAGWGRHSKSRLVTFLFFLELLHVVCEVPCYRTVNTLELRKPPLLTRLQISYGSKEDDSMLRCGFSVRVLLQDLAFTIQEVHEHQFSSHQTCKETFWSRRRRILPPLAASLCLRLEVMIPVFVPSRKPSNMSDTMETNNSALVFSRAYFQCSDHLWSALLTSYFQNGPLPRHTYIQRGRHSISVLQLSTTRWR